MSLTQRRRYVLAGAVVALVSLVLYVPTLLPDVGTWDTAEFQTLGPVLGIAHPTGYPTYTLLAWLGSVVLQPFGNEAYRADLLSALLMSGAAALLAVRAVQATRRWYLGVLAGLLLVTTEIAWRVAVVADAHALHVFLAMLILVVLAAWAVRHRWGSPTAGRWLLAAAVIYGLSLGNHALTLLLAPGIAAYVLVVAPRLLWQRPRLVVGSLGVALGTAGLVYLYLPLRSVMDPPLDYADPQSWEAFWYVVLGEQFQGTFRGLPPATEILASAWDGMVVGFGVLAIAALAGLALGAVRHPRLTLLTGLWFACSWLFALGYPNAAIERYYLVPLAVAALWATLAADAALDALRDVLAGSGHETAYRVAAVALVAVLVAVVLLPLPARRDVVDRSEQHFGRVWLDSTLDALEPDAAVVSWWSFSTPLWYGLHVEGRRPDVLVVDDRDVLDDGFGTAENAIDHYLDTRPVYIVRRDRDLPAFEDRYVLELVPSVPSPGKLYRVVGPQEHE